MKPKAARPYHGLCPYIAKRYFVLDAVRGLRYSPTQFFDNGRIHVAEAMADTEGVVCQERRVTKNRLSAKRTQM
jgi:hypothetical protein